MATPRLWPGRARPVRLLSLMAAAAALAGPPAAGAQPHLPGPDRWAKGSWRLSDERTLSRWAYPRRLAWARAAPSAGARRVARLRWATEDGRPEVYLALRGRVAADGAPWVEVRLPRRPNGTTGWVRRAALGRLRVVRTLLVIDRARLRATLYDRGRRVLRVPVGVGAPGTPTPRGRFYVREKLRNLRGDPLYGPWAIGTSAYARLSDWPGGGVVGIHGTDQPWLVPGRPSHGCVRLRNRAVARLARQVPLGTPVRIV